MLAVATAVLLTAEVLVDVAVLDDAGVRVAAAVLVLDDAGDFVAVFVRVTAAVPVLDRVAAGVSVGLRVAAAVPVLECVGVCVADLVPVGVTVTCGELVATGVTVLAPLGVGDTVLAPDGVGDIVLAPVPVGVAPNDLVGVGVDGGVTDSVTGGEADRLGVGEVVASDDEVGVTEGVLVHDGHTGAVTAGAITTPRNAVRGADTAIVVFASVPVLYEYSVWGDVAYSTKYPHASSRPAREMMALPDSSSMASVGVCRVHPPPWEVVPSPTHCAMLLVNRSAVSVIHRLLGPANTNPYGA